MPEETETTTAAVDDRELADWHAETEAAVSGAIREQLRRYSLEHPPPPRPFPIRLAIDLGEVEVLFPNGKRQNDLRRRIREGGTWHYDDAA